MLAIAWLFTVILSVGTGLIIGSIQIAAERISG